MCVRARVCVCVFLHIGVGVQKFEFQHFLEYSEKVFLGDGYFLRKFCWWLHCGPCRELGNAKFSSIFEVCLIVLGVNR